MTSDEMSMVKTIMGLTWDTAYEYGRIGLLKESEINNKNKNDYIEKLIEAAHLEVNKKG